MTAFKLVIYTLLAVLGILTAWLAWENRASEKIAVNIPSAALLAVIGLLATLLFSLKSEVKNERFPTEYIVNPENMTEFHCDFFPAVLKYSDPGFGIGYSAAFTSLGMVVKTEPALVENRDDASLLHLYRDVLLRVVVDILSFTFVKSWDADPATHRLPTGTHTQYQAATDPPRQGMRITRDEIASRFPSCRLIKSDFLYFLNLPPKTQLSGIRNPESTAIQLENKFVSVHILLKERGVEKGVGTFQALCRLENDQVSRYRVLSYVIELSAVFSPLRAEHPDMPLYKRWVDNMFSELKRLDSEQRWADLQREYILLYSNRTESPLEEMKRKLSEKVKEQKE